MVNVKQHITKTKTGKIVNVKQFIRNGNKVDGDVKKLKELRFKVIASSLKEAMKYKNSNMNINVFNNFEKKIRLDVLKFVIKNYNLSKKNIKIIKIKRDKIFNLLQPVIKRVFKNERLNIRFVKNIEKQKIEINKKSVKSKFKYYFVNGNVDKFITSNKSLKKGDIFYNQKIGDDKNWGVTLKREDLKIIQLGEKELNVFSVKIMNVKNGQLKIKDERMSSKELFSIIKKGKL